MAGDCIIYIHIIHIPSQTGGLFVFITAIFQIVYYNGNYAVIYLKKTTNSAIIIVHGF
nr:MAG TPA: hypothetical protein [Caudoviricetes sp.]